LSLQVLKLYRMSLFHSVAQTIFFRVQVAK